MNKIRTVLASVALMGFLVGNTAVAATRSFDALPGSGLEMTAPEVSRSFAPMMGASNLGDMMGEDDGDGTIILIVLGLLVAGGLIAIVSDDGDDDSPG